MYQLTRDRPVTQSCWSWRRRRGGRCGRRSAWRTRRRRACRSCDASSARSCTMRHGGPARRPSSLHVYFPRLSATSCSRHGCMHEMEPVLRTSMPSGTGCHDDGVWVSARTEAGGGSQRGSRSGSHGVQALQSAAPQVKADEVAVMAPEEAIFLTMLALLSPGDHVICTFPGYQSLYEVGPCRCPATHVLAVGWLQSHSSMSRCCSDGYGKHLLLRVLHLTVAHRAKCDSVALHVLPCFSAANCQSPGC